MLWLFAPITKSYGVEAVCENVLVTIPLFNEVIVDFTLLIVALGIL